MLSHPLCYLKRELFKARKSWIFKIFSLRLTLNVMPWISQSSEIKPKTQCREWVWEWGPGDRYILMDYIRFGSSQPPVSLEITTIASLTREMLAIVPKMLLKKKLTYLSNTVSAHFMRTFAAAKASLVIITSVVTRWL